MGRADFEFRCESIRGLNAFTNEGGIEMKKERIWVYGMAALVIVALMSSSLKAQGMFSHPEKSGDKQEMMKEMMKDEDPHRRFREGTMDRHGKSSGKSGHSSFSAKGLTESLKLDEAQSEKMRQLFRDYRKGTILKSAELKIAQIELEESVADENFNLSAIEKKSQIKEKAATALVMVRVNALAKAKDFLSKEQFQKFMGKVAHKMGKSSHHGGMGGRSSGQHGKMGGMMDGGPHGKSGGSDGYDD